MRFHFFICQDPISIFLKNDLRKLVNSLSCSEFDALSNDAFGKEITCFFNIEPEDFLTKVHTFHIISGKNIFQIFCPKH